jgi:glycerol-3-phosphate O-acyltransferase / dihydroxyacetone phosphate acyltransferase
MTPVARLVSDTLSRNRDNSDFIMSILPCSVTFMHREHWRSDVLVTFHPPMRYTPEVSPLLFSVRTSGSV